MLREVLLLREGRPPTTLECLCFGFFGLFRLLGLFFDIFLDLFFDLFFDRGTGADHRRRVGTGADHRRRVGMAPSRDPTSAPPEISEVIKRFGVLPNVVNGPSHCLVNPPSEGPLSRPPRQMLTQRVTIVLRPTFFGCPVGRSPGRTCRPFYTPLDFFFDSSLLLLFLMRLFDSVARSFFHLSRRLSLLLRFLDCFFFLCLRYGPLFTSWRV